MKIISRFKRNSFLRKTIAFLAAFINGFPSKKLIMIGMGIVLVIFAGAFLYYHQYILSLVALILLLILLRIRQLQKIKINSKTGVSADFKK